MKTIKVSEATLIQLDWLVAVCLGGTNFWRDTVATYWIEIDGKDRALSSKWSEVQSFHPTTNWGTIGEIIYRERISITSPTIGEWWARDSSGRNCRGGTNPLIAACRCYVASKMGETVEVPEELG